MPTVAPHALGAHCVGAAFLGGGPAFALADGTVHLLGERPATVEANDGLLAVAAARDELLTAGEDGRVVAVSADASAREIASLGRRWITAVAAGPQRTVAFASGRIVHVVLPDGKMRELAHERSAEGIAFAPKGLRVAVARYNGVTLHFPAAQGTPVDLPWDGAHTGVSFSPDGAYVVTTMQENALHGWRLADGRHMRMSGYPAKVKSYSWSARGRWLATSGSPAAIVWPFTGKDGPMGKAPLELGTRGDSLVTCVACHPGEDMVAIGYADGMVLAVRFADSKEVVLRRGGAGAISALAWDEGGSRLAVGSEAGDCAIVDIAG